MFGCAAYRKQRSERQIWVYRVSQTAIGATNLGVPRIADSGRSDKFGCAGYRKQWSERQIWVCRVSQTAVEATNLGVPGIADSGRSDKLRTLTKKCTEWATLKNIYEQNYSYRRYTVSQICFDKELYMFRTSCSYPCTNIAISNKHPQMHSYVIKSSLYLHYTALQLSALNKASSSGSITDTF